MFRKKPSAELTCEGKEYTYFAFISYTRKDEEYATWLHSHLQSYRLPFRTRRRHPGLSCRCSPVCIDKADVRPGLLDSELRTHVQASKYLIVICSRNAVKKPKYLDDELGYFLEGGGDPSHVIPFIVDDAEQPEVNCFPPKLRELRADGNNILGVNIDKEEGKRRGALIKVVARLHDLEANEVRDDDQRRRITKGIAVALVSALVVLAGYKAFDYYIPKYSYYLDYVEKDALPVGLGPIPDKHQRDTMNSFYCIKTERGGVITELSFQNAQGALMEVDSELYKDRASKMEYVYQDNGKLNSISCYDQNGRIQLVRNYKDLKHADLDSYDEEGSFISSAFLPEQSALGEYDIFNSGAVSEDRSQIASLYFIYDEDGYVKEVHYASESNSELYAEHDSDGIWGLRYERDEQGRIKKESYLTYTGENGDPSKTEFYEVLGTKTGCYGRTFTYDGYDLAKVEYFDARNKSIHYRGCAAVTCVYNDLHQRKERHYLGTDGKPCYNETKGFSYQTYTYDPNGKLKEIQYFDTNENPTLCLEGYASLSCEYDDQGRQHILSVKGTDGAPVLSTGCYAKVQYDYDQQGNQNQTTYFDTEGNPTPCDEGYTRVRMEYNDKGQVVDAWYYDGQGELTLTTKGYAHMRVQYTKLGDRESIEYFSDYDGEEPALYNGQYASVHCVYNRQNNLEKIWFCGINGEWVAAMSDVAGEEFTYYRDDGRLRKVTYLGTDGNPVLCSSGYASAEYIYDEQTETVHLYDAENNPCLRNGISIIEYRIDNRGRQIEERYYGTLYEPVLSKSEGFARIVIAYNDCGNKIRVNGFGVDGNPALGNDGYASVSYEYDDQQRLAAARYYGTDDQLIQCVDGNAVERQEYNDYGRVIRTSYYGTDDKPISRDDGVAVKEYEYDERGNRKSMRYYNAEGFPVESTSGYASTECVYDYRGNTLSAAYYDANGDPTLCKYGYAKVEYQYDLRDNRTLYGYYGTDGQPMLHHDDFAFMEITYNRRNQYEQIRLYGTAHQPILGKDGYAFKEYEYDEAGNNTRMSYYDVNHEPVLAKVGHFAIEMTYDHWGNVLTVSYYDTDNQLIAGENGYARAEYSFDAMGRYSGTAYFDEEGQPMMGRSGYARSAFVLDEDGNVISATIYDAEGTLLP